MERPTYVVVGSGPSGVLLTLAFLHFGHDVILLERGTFGADLHADSRDPTLWGKAAYRTCEGTRKLTAALRKCSNRSIQYNQGKGIGGSFNINAMIFSAGHKSVFDHYWSKRWNSDVVEIALQRTKEIIQPSVIRASSSMERMLHHGNIERNIQDELHKICLMWPWERRGFATNYVATIEASLTDDKPQRLSLAKLLSQYQSDFDAAELRHSNQRKGKLTVLSNMAVLRIIFRGSIAEGVEAKNNIDGMISILRPSLGGEVIICAGVFETPRILIDSGLKNDVHRGNEIPVFKPSDHFATQSIRQSLPDEVNEYAKHTLPCLDDIGMNLQDHIVLPMMWIGNWWQAPGAGLWSRRSHAGGAGILPPNGVHGWIYLNRDGSICADDSSEIPCAQLLLLDGRSSPGILPELLFPRVDKSKAPLYANYIRPVLTSLLMVLVQFSVVQWACGFVFGFLVCCVRPHSSGQLLDDRKRSPGEPLLVDLGLLTDDRDLIVLSNAAAAARRVVNRARAQFGLCCLEILPGPLVGSELGKGGPSSEAAAVAPSFALYTQLFCTTYFHACGTCGMAADSFGAVGAGYGKCSAGDLHVNSLPPSSKVDRDAKDDSVVVAAKGGCDDSLVAGQPSCTVAEEETSDGSLKEEDEGVGSGEPWTRVGAAVGAAVGTGVGSGVGSGVVDSELRVRGVLGLRVADASVIPPHGIPSAPIAATCMAIGLRAADIILASAGGNEVRKTF